jgi:CheY-like chemotaxis protein
MKPILRELIEGRGLTPLRVLLDGGLLALVTVASVGVPESPVGPEQVWWLFPPTALAALAFGGLYRHARRVDSLEGLLGVAKATALAALLTLTLASLLDPRALAATHLPEVWGVGTAVVLAGRMPLTLARRSLRKRDGGTPTLILGAGRIGARVEHELRRRPELGLRPVGFLDGTPAPKRHASGRRAPILGAPFEMERVVEETGAGHVIVAFSSVPDSILAPLLRASQRSGVEVSLVPRLFESINGRIGFEHVVGLPLLVLGQTRLKGRQRRPRVAAGRHEHWAEQQEAAGEVPRLGATNARGGADPAPLQARVLIADDHVPTRAGIRRVLEREGFLVCGEAPTAEAAVEAALRERPDICLVDVHMPGSGIEAAAQIITRLSETAVVMLTVSTQEVDLVESLRAGARGYLLKDMDPAQLSQALRRVLAGEVVLPGRIRRSRS